MINNVEKDYSICDATDDFAALANNIHDYIEEDLGERKEIPQSNTELIMLNNIRAYLLSLVAYIRAFCNLQERMSKPQFIEVLNIGFDANQLENGEMPDVIYGFPIKSLVVMAHFQIDSYLGYLCEKRGIPQIGFYRRIEEIKQFLVVDENMKNTWLCLASFRNSFHTNGGHKININKWGKDVKGKPKEPRRGMIDRAFEAAWLKNGKRIKETLTFRHNEGIEYNWISAFLLVKESVEILMQVMNEVRNEQYL